LILAIDLRLGQTGAGRERRASAAETKRQGKWKSDSSDWGAWAQVWRRTC
jgi:hypothetical protein